MTDKDPIPIIPPNDSEPTLREEEYKTPEYLQLENSLRRKIMGWANRGLGLLENSGDYPIVVTANETGEEFDEFPDQTVRSYWVISYRFPDRMDARERLTVRLVSRQLAGEARLSLKFAGESEPEIERENPVFDPEPVFTGKRSGKATLSDLKFFDKLLPTS